MNQRRPLFHGFVGIEDRRQRLVFHRYQIQGPKGRLFIHGRDARHILPDIPNLIHCQHGVVLGVLEDPPLDAVGIGRRHHGLDAGKFQRLSGIDIQNFGVGMGLLSTLAQSILGSLMSAVKGAVPGDLGEAVRPLHPFSDNGVFFFHGTSSSLM